MKRILITIGQIALIVLAVWAVVYFCDHFNEIMHVHVK